ncbi:hypothetical protein PF006_g26801 [Phytophthora fragariae]|uniref:Uncharacterized protein n=1 Tax=Phytophthora fragariae TaxID=53985 RepID=A0A6A3QU62_9STRA|nr:hypothetical protein PF006_g26801 [Phytophthora fragariae]
MAATPPLPPLEVASAAFFRLECSHAQLFQTEYKRSNRTKGLKILRCFPHCCPEHIDRSYCGTSLSVRVELAARASDAAPPPPSQVVAVFARFEATSDVSLRPGECVEVAKMAAGTQSDSKLEGQWVAGSLDRPSRLVTTIRTPGTPSDDHKPLVFHLNGKPFSRWYYDWESGANKAHRLTKHVLKAYIVERCAVDQHDNFTDFTRPCAHTQLYRVLHVVSSPEFTVISYRRAPSKQFQFPIEDGSALGYEEAAQFSQDMAGSSDSAYEPHSHSFADRSTELRPPMDVKLDPFFSDLHQAKRQRASSLAVRSSISRESSGLLEDKLRWEHANASAVAVSKNLALAYSLLGWAPLRAYAACADELVHLVHHSLQESLVGPSKELSKLNCFSKLVLDQVQANQGAAVASSSDIGMDGAVKAVPRDLDTLLRALAQAALWPFSADTMKWMRTFFRQYACSVVDKHALRGCFVLFVEELQDRLDTQVFKHTTMHSLANVAEEVIAAVYSHECFHARRPQVRGILSGQDFAGWNAFVAQMRETYINMSTCTSVARGLAQNRPEVTFSEVHPPRNRVENAWNDAWQMDVEEAVWRPSEQPVKVDIGNGSGSKAISDDAGSLSLLSMVQVISQLVRLEVALDIEARMLHVRSTQGVSGTLDCMRLTLDGKERVFSQFPNGMASSISAGLNGDYIAEMRVDQSGRLVVYLQTFTWSQNGPSYHVRIRIECWRSQRLCVSGDVLATTAPTSFTSDDALYLGEMSLQDKREAVEKAFSQQLRENSATAWASSSPWQESGRFRLSYTKRS